MPQPSPSTHASFSAQGANLTPEQKRLRWRVLTVLLLCVFMSLMNVSTVNVIVPNLQHSFSASNESIQWVLSGYVLTFGIILIAAGRIGDMIGRGGVFLIGSALFGMSSLACALASDAHHLNIFRLVQGAAAGIINPQCLGLIQQYFAGRERGRAFGFMGTVVGLSFALGPLLSGLCIYFAGEELGWRLVFFSNVPIAAAAFILGLKWFPRPLFSDQHQSSNSGRLHVLAYLDRVDPIGILLLAAAVFCLLYPFVKFESTGPVIWVLLPVSALLLWTWFRWEVHRTRVGHPMIDLNLFKTPSFTNGVAIMGIYFLGMTSIWIMVAIFFQKGAGHSALATGLLGLPSSLLAAWVANISGRYVMTLGRKLLAGGLIIAIVSLLLTILVFVLHDRTGLNEWWAILTLSLLGLGQGAVVSPNQTLSLVDVPVHYGGSAGAVLQTSQRIGASVGIALITGMAFSLQSSTSWGISTSAGLGIISVLFAGALLITLLELRARSRSARTPDTAS